MSASEIAMRGGQPSITTPMPPPWDSPKVVMRKSWPKLLPITRSLATASGENNESAQTKLGLAASPFGGDALLLVERLARSPQERPADLPANPRPPRFRPIA